MRHKRASFSSQRVLRVAARLSGEFSYPLALPFPRVPPMICAPEIRHEQHEAIEGVSLGVLSGAGAGVRRAEVVEGREKLVHSL